jgi:integrase/recombinase XerD
MKGVLQVYREKKVLKRIGKVSPCRVKDRDFVDRVVIEEFITLHEEFLMVKQLENASPRTVEDYKINFRYFIEFIQSPVRFDQSVRSIDLHIIRSYIHYMMTEKQYKVCTINIRLRTIRTYLKWLYREEYLDKDIALHIKILKETTQTLKVIKEGDIKKFMRGIDTSSYDGFRNYTIILLMLTTGVRVTECLNIKLEDVNLMDRLITIRKDSAKTRIERRIPISQKLKSPIKELMEIASHSGGDEYIFQSVYGGQMTSGQLRDIFRKHTHLAGLKENITPHKLRHTFATNYIKKGGDPFTLQKVLGHTTMYMTRRYVTMNSDDIRKVSDKINLIDQYLK